MEHTASNLKNNRKRRRKVLWLGFLALLVLVAGIWGVMAKYTQKREYDASIRAKEFYFVSDYLTAGGKTYEINADEDGTASVNFLLQNHIDQLRFTEDPIEWTVVCERISGSGVEVSPNPDKGTLNGQKISDASVTLSGLKSGNTYQVTAEGKAGYEQTLQATFVIKEHDTNIYKHLNTSEEEYVILTVWTKKNFGEVTVAFPAGLIPDNTDPELEEIVNYNSGYKAGSFKESFAENTSQHYRFFKEDLSDVYSVKDFSVKLSGNEAVIGTP